MKKILVYGYGNPGRQDDALGNMLVEKIEEWVHKNEYTSISTDSNYQLNIEDAYELNEYDIVVYADASIEEMEEFRFEVLKPELNTNFSMHSVSPAFVLGLCKEIYDTIPEAFLLHIKGYEWEFMEDMSKKAKSNLETAFNFLVQKLEFLIQE